MDIGDILIAAAVPGELEGIQASLMGAAAQCTGMQQITAGRIGEQQVRLAVTGPGLANAVHGITAAVTARRPRLILQIGCGGGFSAAGLDIGDVAVASVEIDAHLGVAAEGENDVMGRLPFPVIKDKENTIYNRYPVDAVESKRVVDKLEEPLTDLETGVKVCRGPFVTVATVTASPTGAEVLYRRHGALVENMEGAGVAHVAALYGIPFIEIRAVSNRVGDRDKRRWNLPLAFENCARAIRAYLD